jgi:hypothetical protein
LLLGLRAAVGVTPLWRTITIRQRPQKHFQEHEDGYDRDGQTDPTERTKDFVTHLISPRIESSTTPADSERLRRVAQIVLSSPDILKSRIGHVYC